MKYTSIVFTFLPFLATAKLGERGQGNRHLQGEPPIVKVGVDPPTPLGRCEGDCDGNSECDSGLKCFKRTAPFIPVPGCSGGAQDSSKFDYCVRNSDNFPVLSKKGVNPGVPLERCEGDCDSDSDCASSDLFCFAVTQEKTVVPGCRGGQSDTSLFDYCIRRVDAPPGVAPTAPTSDPTPPSFAAPTPDPTPGPTPDPTPSSFAAPTPDPTPGPTPDPTSPPAAAPTPTSPTRLPLKITQSFPLGLCEGDCDDDPDCEPGLICFQRDGNESVPGCSGGSRDGSRTDYCIPENAPNPPPTSPPAPAPAPPPTSPSRLPLKITQSFPLGRCEGDCDKDADCQSGLKCFQRDAGDSVPACSGGSRDGSRTDYCIPKNNTPTPAPDPKNKSAFRLKLYWQEGYYWQEETFERKWCMRCSNNFDCSVGEPLFLGDCGRWSKSAYFEFVYLDDNKVVQIQVVSLSSYNDDDSTKMCLERGEDRKVTLQVCRNDSSNNEGQRWTASRGSFTMTGDRFEISDDNGYCLTSHHHPKYGEQLELYPCKEPRHDTTNYWNVY
eukprot:scaffold4127_cov126-Cylindrotheca_fusiformis.AAC.2